jgi:hypothetical protein
LPSSSIDLHGIDDTIERGKEVKIALTDSVKIKYWFRACRRASEWLALLGRRRLTFDHEIFAGTRTTLKQIVPPLALWHDHAAAADLQNVDLVHARRKGDGSRQPDNLAMVDSEYSRACYGFAYVSFHALKQFSRCHRKK